MLQLTKLSIPVRLLDWYRQFVGDDNALHSVSGGSIRISVSPLDLHDANKT